MSLSTPTVDEIPDIVISRLPIYLRTLRLLQTQGAEVTSSQELGHLLGIGSAQIRKDLSHFGEFGKQGTGYTVDYLCHELEKILKVDCIWPVIMIGAGYLGHALASYTGFEHRGFRIVGVSDNAPAKIDSAIGEIAVQPLHAMAGIVAHYRCQIAVIAVPATSAQHVADEVIAAGVQSILCYAPITLTAPPQVHIEYIDPVIYFQHMTFYLNKGCIESA